ncbi:MAG TPA: FMN-binding protein [Nocardioides sp.]|nr:FMN-binding protein [Nocardioides sp.]
MRRIALWLASTVSVLVLLLGYHTSTEGVAASASAPPAVVSSAGTTDASPTTSSTGTASKRSTTTTVTGDVAQTQWGPVQVALTITDGRITAVAVPQYPSGDPKDQEINSYALPTLVQETISAQGAGIDMVSGATVTSTGYLQSLQSALDKASL